MVAGRTQSIDLAVRHVTKRCERVPQARVAMSDNPFQSVESEYTTNVTVFVNVTVVIEVDELMAECFPKDEPDDRSEKNADGDREPAIVTRDRRRRTCRHWYTCN